MKIKLLLLALLFTAIPKSMWAYTKDDIVTVDNHTYKVLVPDGTTGVQPTLMFIGTTVSGHLNIPSEVRDGKGISFKVTAVGSHGSAYKCEGVTSITLPETIETIEKSSFCDAQVAKITIPKNVSKIEPTAWLSMKAIPEFEVVTDNPYFDSDSDGVLYTENKKDLRAVPSNIAEKKGETYTIDASVKSINKAAFHMNPGLKKVVLPPNLETVEEGWPSIAATSELEAFVEPTTPGTTKFEVIDGVLVRKAPTPKRLVLYPHAKNEENYMVPTGVKEIASYGIAGNQNMTSIDLNEVTNIDISALVDLGKLKKIILPKDLKKKGLKEGAFEGCQALEEYVVAEGNTDFSAEAGVLFSKDQSLLYAYPLAKPATSYTIPDKVKKIGTKAFQGARKLTTLVIPTNVEDISEQAFRQNYSLTSITFLEPSKITNLNGHSFWQCPRLKEVTLPSSITEIGRVFEACDSLHTINVPDNSKLETIKESAFISNTQLKHFNFKGTCPLKNIKENAFAKAENLERFDFPKTVTNIGRNAFNGCKNMKAAKFDENAAIDSIGAGAFADCGLESLDIPKNVKEIKKEAFRNCGALEKIKIEKYTTKIHPEAFKYCDKLTEINVDKENTVYSSVDGYLLSQDKEELIIFPHGKANDKFTLLPPSIKRIGDYSFLDCRNLKNVIIPNKVEKIGKRAFSLCKNLNLITFLCDKVIPVDSINTKRNEMSFDDGQDAPDMFPNITIHVRKELYDKYNEIEFYNKFKGLIEQSFLVGTEEYIPVSETVVDLLKTESTDHTFVLPTSVKHPNKNITYSVNLIGDYAFQKTTDKVKEVVVKKNIEYIGAQAFVTDIKNRKSTVESVFFIESEPTKRMLSTTRFELDETNNNYNEFADTTHIYVKKSAVDKYKSAWKKEVYNIEPTHGYIPSPFDFTKQIDYRIPGVNITTKYGTFAREFDVDFSVYKTDKGSCDIGAFVSKNSDVKEGKGDYGTSKYHVRMKSVDENGGARGKYGYVPECTGVLLKVLDKESTPNDFYYAIGELDDTSYNITDNIMKGITVNPASVSASATDPIYVMQGGIFRKVTSTIEVFPIHKAYAKIDGVPAGAKLSFDFSDDGETTGIITAETENTTDDVYYNLNGQRVTNPQHGVFIHRGHKVIIK